jgi:hypothetical protein
MKSKKIQANATHVFCSRRNSGKSYLAKYVLHSLVQDGLVDEVFIISQTEHISKSFDVFDDEHIVKEYNPVFIENLIKQQAESIKKLGKEKAPKVVLILDDVIGTVSPNDSTLNSLFTLSRHVNISVFLLVQHVKLVFSPCLRQNVDYLYIGQVNDEALTVLFNVAHYPGSLKDFKNFIGKSQEGKFTFVCYDSLTDGEAWGTVKAGKPFDFKLVYKKEKRKNQSKEKQTVKTNENGKICKSKK